MWTPEELPASRGDGRIRARCGHSTRRSTLPLAVERIVIDELAGK